MLPEPVADEHNDGTRARQRRWQTEIDLHYASYFNGRRTRVQNVEELGSGSGEYRAAGSIVSIFATDLGALTTQRPDGTLIAGPVLPSLAAPQ